MSTTLFFLLLWVADSFYLSFFALSSLFISLEKVILFYCCPEHRVENDDSADKGMEWRLIGPAKIGLHENPHDLEDTDDAEETKTLQQRLQ